MRESSDDVAKYGAEADADLPAGRGDRHVGQAARRGTLIAAAAALLSVSAPAPAADAAAASAAAASAVVTSSGLRYLETRAGNGAAPAATDTVRVHYVGRFADGREFDSSIARGQPAEFPLNRVIKCWTEGVQRMRVGAKAQLVCPPAIAYGERGTPGGPIPPNATLHFEVELLGVVKR